ncbi:NADP-dependent oxidoreductase [Hyphococcus sp.]|uniref:NADP-dependent oxidoreductase n=1 Tax=Hyphococcus sp. TaxID=2038636 RepID=UPI0035C6B5DB
MKAFANTQVILNSRPHGVAQAENFSIVETRIAGLAPGNIRVKNQYLSVEPAMRGWIADKGNYSAQVEIGSVMRALAAGTVVESNNGQFSAGDRVMGWFGWQDYADVEPAAVIRTVCEDDLPLSLSLGVLGINGVTALLALTKIGAPKSGETVLVSTAAGAVGSAAGQIAKIFGCRTVGVTGGPEKAAICLDEYGYDAAIDYRNENMNDALERACPNGVNVYYDNTAGSISDRVMCHLALNARIIVCGTAAEPKWDPWPAGPRVERHLLVKRARMEGFVIFDYMDEFDAAAAKLADWVRSGELRYREDILDGIEACPDALAGLYRSENFGKRVIRLQD